MQDGGRARADTATVLFTDLVGSTELRTRLGEEAADELRHVHDRLVGSAIRAHRGTVVKQLGDGVMATFTGAADGLAGAVAIQQAIDLHNRSAANERLDVRIGVSVGDVTFEDDDCFGLPVIEAQRLEAAAAPGQILCCQAVQLMSRGRGGQVFVPIGDLDLKGIEGLVTVLEVGWTPVEDRPSAAELPRLLSTQGSFGFAGRTRELATLVEAWKHTTDGASSVVLISGEPGIGKTRLVSELARRALEDEGVVLAGRCDEQVSVAYRPFTEALRLYLPQVAGQGAVETLGARAGELRRLVPELDEEITDLPDLLGGDGEVERFQLLDAIAGWLRTVTTAAPVLLVLDDLHWADGPTLIALRHVVDEVADAPLLIVGTYRDTDLDRTHPLALMLADFRRRDSVSRLDLSGLTADGVSEFLQTAAGHELDPAGTALAEAVYQETAGNPFFIGEVLRHLAESGALVQRDGTWTSDLTLQEVGIPEGIREVVGRRLNRLSDEAGRALSAAAIVGHQFEVDVVVRVADMSEDDVLDALDEAATANLVLDDGIGRYRFAHALVRATLEEELSTTRRARLHRRTALALEDLHAGHLEEIAPQLAHHWAETADPDPSTAIRWTIVAGQQNLDRAAPDDALRWFESAVELLDPDHPDLHQRAELLVLSGTAKMYLGDPSFRDVVMEGARQALAVGDAALAAEALMANPRTSWTRGVPSDPERMAVIEAALELVDPDDHQTHLRLLLAHSEQLLFLGDREGRMALVEEVIEMLSTTDLPQLAFIESVGWLNMLVPPTEVGRADVQGLAAQARVAVLREGTTIGKLRNEFSEWFWSLRTADREAYDEGLARMTNIRPGVTSIAVEMVGLMHRIIDAQLHGCLDEADAAAARLLELSTAPGDDSGRNYEALNSFITARERGILAEIRPVIEALHSHEAAGPTAAIRASGLAECAPDLALVELEAARPFDDVADDPGYQVTVCEYVHAAAVLRHAEAALELRPLVEALDNGGQEMMLTGGYAPGSIGAFLARLSATMGDHGRADAQFLRGIAACDRLGATAHQARERVDYATFCLRLGRTDDAWRLAQEALDLVTDTELVDSRNRATALLAQLDG